MSFCCEDLLLIFQVITKGVPPVGASLFNDLVITALIEFVIIKVGPIQGFQDPTVLAEKLMCSRYRLQANLAAIAAYLVVPIPVGERKVGAISKLSRCIVKLLLDEVKLFWQVGSAHLFVKEIKRA